MRALSKERSEVMSLTAAILGVVDGRESPKRNGGLGSAQNDLSEPCTGHRDKTATPSWSLQPLQAEVSILQIIKAV